MTDLSYHAIKQHIQEKLDISSTDLEVIKHSFAALYTEFQTDACKQVTIEKVADTCFSWVRNSESKNDRGIIYLHGGGYTMGSTQDHLEMIAQIVLENQVKVLSVDYRLCPEFQFPAPLEDVGEAYQFLLKQGYKPEQIGLVGISAGALLITQFLLKCEQDNLSKPGLAVVLSGPANLKLNSPAYQYNLDRDWISTERMKNVQNYYLPKNYGINDILLNPLNAHYTSYPKTLFQAGDYELLIDDCLHYYQRLREQQFDVNLQVIEGLPHCWQFFAKVFQPGRIALQQMNQFIRNYYDK